MSVFKLSELAGWMRVNEKTLRRWCIAGRVRGAYQTKGGHWRVCRKEKAVLVASRILRELGDVPSAGATRKFQRRTRDRMAKKIQAVQRGFARLFARGRGKYLLHATDAISARVDQLEITEDERQRLLAGLKEVVRGKEISQEVWREVCCVAAGLWVWDAENSGRRGLSGAASMAGLPRNTFRNYFAQYLPKRSDALEEPQSEDEIDFDGMDERLGWAEPLY